MQSVTLCNCMSALRSQSPSTSPKLLKSPAHPLRISRLSFSKYSKLWSCYVAEDKKLLGHSTESHSATIHDAEVSFNDGENGIQILCSAKNESSLGSVHLETSPKEINTAHEGDVTESFIQDNASFSGASFLGALKVALLAGLLTFQEAKQALASSGFAAGLLSIPYLEDLGDISTGFASALLLIFFSELGDKTFFIAALLAARNSGLVVFIGTFGALAAMTIISVVLGRTFHYVDEILPFRFGGTDLPIDDIAAVLLLVYFGVSTLLEASSGDSLKAEEEQKEAELAVSDFSGNGSGILAAASTVIGTFTLVFVAEWGDKSFFSTIALAAAASPLGVVSGALAGHAIATLIAVVGGSLLGTFLSEKVIAYTGGALFLVFALATLIEIFN